MTKFDVEMDKRPLFRVMRQYMQMVLEMLLFIRSVRIGDWELHLMVLETFIVSLSHFPLPFSPYYKDFVLVFSISVI